jgi:hypothetical protein
MVANLLDPAVDAHRRAEAAQSSGSVLGLVGEEPLRGVVPVERLLGTPPTPLHRVARLLVGRASGLLGLLQVSVLGLDDVVGRLAPVLQVAGAAQLATVMVFFGSVGCGSSV